MDSKAINIMSGFDKFFYTAKDEATGLPMGTRLIYRICDNDPVRFDEECEMLKRAYEAGLKDGASHA